MTDEYDLITTKLLEFELQGEIKQEQKAVLASAISRILDSAVRKRDALAVLHIQKLEARLGSLKTTNPPVHEEIESPNYANKYNAKKKVFIVHGRNNEMKHATARVIEKLGLDAIILS